MRGAVMGDCECIGGCAFLNDKMANMPSVADIYKDKYCRSDWSTCARYHVFSQLGRENVPLNLYPNELQRADDLMGR
jgi:hypothetical protein